MTGNKKERRKIVMDTVVHRSIRSRFWLIVAVIVVILQGCAHAPTSEVNVARITKEELRPMVGSPEVIIVDVRTAQDWKEAQWKIKGAVWADRNDEKSSWVVKYPKDKTFVLY
jgi:hypothetical protein